MRFQGTSYFTSLELSDTKVVPKSVQILKVGKFQHPEYGFFEITTSILDEMKKNFDARVRGIDIAFDYYHASDREASAWVKGLELRADGNELWAEVQWTPKAEEKIANRELRYFSPDFAFEWVDPESSRLYKNVLFGGGLTNRPFLKEMAPIIAKEPDKKLDCNIDKKLSSIPEGGKMDEKDKMIEELKKQVADLQAQCEQMKMSQEAMLKEKDAALAAKVMAEKQGEFNKLLTEGKVCAAQEKAFLDNDMPAFIKLAQPVNLKNSGSGANDNVVTDEKILELAETKRKANPKMEMGDAISEARRELMKK